MPKKETEEQKNKRTKKQKNRETEEQKERTKEQKNREEAEKQTVKKMEAKAEVPTEKVEEAKKKMTKKSGSAKDSLKKENKKDASEERSESKRSRKYREVEVLVEKEKYYTAEEAVGLAQKTSTTKFDSSIEVHIRLGIDPSKADQQLRGTVALPHGTGKTKRVAVICAPDKEKEAKDAGAEKVGGDSLIADIEKGKLDFDILVATPDMMAKVGKLGKILGTKGLMPNPKAGTVTPDVGKAVKELKAGRVEFKLDKDAIIHQVIGKVSFDEKKLEENYNVFIDAIKHAKPSGVKGTYIRSISLATTMGPGIKIEV